MHTLVFSTEKEKICMPRHVPPKSSYLTYKQHKNHMYVRSIFSHQISPKEDELEGPKKETLLLLPDTASLAENSFDA